MMQNMDCSFGWLGGILAVGGATLLLILLILAIAALGKYLFFGRREGTRRP